MKSLFDRTFDILERSIDLKVKRNSIITSNITNLDTPGYKAKDIPFKEIMARYLDQPGGASDLAMRATNPGHFGSGAGASDNKMYIKPAHDDDVITRPDGQGTPNDVDLDHEMAELAINNIQFQETVQSLIKQFEMLKTAITEGGKV